MYVVYSQKSSFVFSSSIPGKKIEWQGRKTTKIYKYKNFKKITLSNIQQYEKNFRRALCVPQHIFFRSDDVVWSPIVCDWILNNLLSESKNAKKKIECNSKKCHHMNSIQATTTRKSFLLDQIFAVVVCYESQKDTLSWIIWFFFFCRILLLPTFWATTTIALKKFRFHVLLISFCGYLNAWQFT